RPKGGELLGGHGEIGIEDHEDVAGRGVETSKARVAFAAPRLAHGLDVAFGISGGDALDLLPRAVLRVTLDEDDLELLDEGRDAFDRRLDVAALVARGNDDAPRADLSG